jgi:predicted TIM-barrel fold metal-dependent hydrolase
VSHARADALPQRFEIVDAQVHLNQLVPDWRTAEPDAVIATAIAAMDAVGIDAALIAESRGFDAQMRPALGPVLPNGAVRGEFPFSERAVALHPDRFAYLVRIDPRDPELERLMSEVRGKPGALCVRIVPVPNIGEVAAFERGEFEPLLAAAAEHDVPIFCWFPGRAHLLVPYLKKYPQLQFILDHCGVGVAPPRIGVLPPTLQTSVTETLAERQAQLERVIDLAQYPNLALKWCHAPGFLSEQPYPHRDMQPWLRKALDAFGKERIMWASDYTVSRVETGFSWAHTLHYLLDWDVLSDSEKEWLLGGSVRQVLRWPAPRTTPQEVTA